MHTGNKHPLITGTLILTFAGLLSRVIGFFYRIFLSRTIGAEGIGIYQMLSPVLVICFSLSTAGIQSAISRFVAAYRAHSNEKAAIQILYLGTLLSLSVSMILSFLLFFHADDIATALLFEKRCADLIRIFAFSIPLEAIHGCINGYFYGKKDSRLPALSQLAEQLTRVCFVYGFYKYLTAAGLPFTLHTVAFGSIVGEICSVLLCLLVLRLRTHHFHFISYTCLKELTGFALPLTLNRTIISLLCSIEAVFIPSKLQLYGYSTRDALSIYGVLTGMALPLILFPSAITNSASVMLLPVISESDSAGDKQFLLKTIQRTIISCLSIGVLCMSGFLVFGNYAGILLFKNRLAGTFITTLSFICPFLYLNTALASILHGLGKTLPTFFINCFSISLRLLFTFISIPSIGIRGFLYGLLASQIFSAFFYLVTLSRNGFPFFSLLHNKS